MKMPTLSPSKPLIEHLNLMFIAGTTKKQLIDDSGMSYAVLNKVLNGESVNYQFIKHLQTYEVDTRPDRQAVLDSINKLIDAGISKLDIALQASMSRISLDHFIEGERVARSTVLRKLDYAVKALQEDYEFRIKVHNLLIEAIDNGLSTKDISKASGVGLSAIYEIIYANSNPRKTTVKKLHAALIHFK